ncbi:tail fiber domain-containing protein, partial [candidate division KSB1 bacterium]|nr:tail fiber domain-containing protein [candidate division KSB1 bacterium]
TTAPTALLSVNGTASKPGGGSWGVFSDIRLKKDISPFADGLGLVNQINPIWFRYNGKAGLPTDKKYVGVIAQEIEKIAPYLIEKKMVNEGGTEEEYMEYDGSAMDFILINAIKEQQKIIAAQNAELKRMKTQLAEFDGMKSRMAKIEAALQKMEILTAKKESEKKSSATETAEVSEGSE